MTIHPDGTAEAKIATQDIGTGTRTVVAIVLADTLGLPLDAVQARIGDSRYPASGGSGGSTTVGGVSSATRRAALNALGQVFAKAAPALKATPAELEAVDGKIRVKAAPERAMTWKQAMALFGRTPVTAAGANPGAGRADHQRRRRRADGRRGGGRRDRRRQDQEDGRGAGLRPDRRSPDRGEPGLRRPDHGDLDRARPRRR